MDKQTMQLVRKFRKKGWTVESNGSGHLTVKDDDGHMTVLARSPSDHRWLKNKLTDMRRKGFDMEGLL